MSKDESLEKGRNWYAVYTRSRHEKVAAEELWHREVEVFRPYRNVISKWKDRRKEVQFPLFPGYLFTRCDIQRQRLDILKVPAVVRIIGFNNEPEPIPAEEYKYKWKNAKWTKILEDAIRFSKLANMPAKDWKQFHFKKNIGTIEEWAKVMVEMAYWESKFKPEATYKENFRNSKGQYIYYLVSTSINLKIKCCIWYIYIIN